MTRPADRLRIASRSALPDDGARAPSAVSLDHVVPARDRRQPVEGSAPALNPVRVLLPEDGAAANVLIFPGAGAIADHAAPVPDVAARPAPAIARARRVRLSALFIGLSLAVHGAAAAFFFLDSERAPSIGREVITVELVLGAENLAGHAQQASQSESQESKAIAGDKKLHPVPEPDEKADTKKVDVAKADPPLPKQAEPEQAPKADATPATISDDAPAVSIPAPRPERVSAAKPVEKKVVQQTKPEPKSVSREDRRREAVGQESERRREREAERQRAARAAAVASSGVGRGSSAAAANYQSAVLAHLSRYRNKPTGTGKGTAQVNFTITGSGVVTAVRLARSAGNATYDREAQAMPRRASPFPPPPNGRSRSFTVPIHFR